MYCSQCGKELKADEKFCSQCGKAIKNDTTEQIKDTVKDVGSKLKGFWNKAKETCIEAYKNAFPPVPNLEIEFNEEIEKILLDMGFKWFYSNINGEKLRLYKYYTGANRIEIETFANEMADIYVYATGESKIAYVLVQIMYDIIRLRKHIYVRYTNTDEKIKLIDFCNLHDIIDENTSYIVDKICMSICINKDFLNNLTENGFTTEESYTNDGNYNVNLINGDINVWLTLDSKEDLKGDDISLSNAVNIKNPFIYNDNNYENNIVLNILKLLKIIKYLKISIWEDKDNNSNIRKTTLSSFLGNSDVEFLNNTIFERNYIEGSGGEFEEEYIQEEDLINEQHFKIISAIGLQKTTINTKRNKRK